MEKRQIAIDGPSGAGKSTIARALAKRLGMIYVDTGAMYRAIGVKAQRTGIPTRDEAALAQMLAHTQLGFAYIEGKQHILIDGEDAEEQIRTPQAALAASEVSAVPAVRAALVGMQRELARCEEVVMDGRDIGTHVLPDAPYKFFVTASVHIRANRRHKELVHSGREIPYERVLAEIIERDERDTKREIAPLRQAQDAVLIQTDNLTVEQAVEKMLEQMGDSNGTV